MHAISRLLSVAVEAEGPAVVQRALVQEARTLFGVGSAVLLSVASREGVVRMAAWRSDQELVPVASTLSGLPGLTDGRSAALALRGSELDALGRALGLRAAPGVALALPVRTREALEHILILIDADPARTFDAARLELATGFAAAAASALAQLQLVEEQTQRTRQQAALARAAKTLNATLELQEVLSAIASEAKLVLDGDNAAAYLGGGQMPLTVASCIGLQPNTEGRRLALGEGLSGRVALADRAMLTNDYQRIARPAAGSPFTAVQSCLSVPMHWDDALRGVLSVGFNRPRFVDAHDLALLEAFGQIAAAACRNAVAAADLKLAARTDGLTGCLNHAALQEALGRELRRCERTGEGVAVVLLDLDDFKQVNERAGHLIGDEVLRRVGQALRAAVRPYDVVARYGGDEFAVIAVGADEATAAELGQRILDRVAQALKGLELIDTTVATAGVAARDDSVEGAALLERADRALLFGKQVLGRGRVVRTSEVPAAYRTGERRPRELSAATARPFTVDAPQPTAPQPPGVVAGIPPAPVQITADGAAGVPEVERRSGLPRRAGDEHERLHKRNRQLALASALGARLAAMTDAAAITDATVDELHRAFGFFLCAALERTDDREVRIRHVRGAPFQQLDERGWSQPDDVGIIGRALRLGTVQLCFDARLDPDYLHDPETIDTRAEMVAPVWVGERLWGVLNVEEVRPGAFDADDARLLQTVADQMGSALRSAELYEQLERAYLGTAEALATALEAKDAYTAQHASSIAHWAEAVGRRLGMLPAALRSLRYGAIFHDIGKIAVPEEILNKRGPLDDVEREVIERHTVVGEQILAPVEFLRDVLPIVRHEHERWDGQGYPDQLRGMAIPLASRIVLCCDAFHAMTSDRPYRAALSHEDALEELQRHAGSQFDPLVVDALCAVLEDEAALSG